MAEEKKWRVRETGKGEERERKGREAEKKVRKEGGENEF